MKSFSFAIDGARFDTLEGFFDEVDRTLMGEEFWGRNIDAFNDILSGGMGRIPDDEFTLLWRSSHLSRQHLGHAETARWFRAVLPNAHPSGRTEMRRRAEQADRGEGETLFDTLVEIIRAHPKITLRLE